MQQGRQRDKIFFAAAMLAVARFMKLLAAKGYYEDPA
jgi:hypothetical protein